MSCLEHFASHTPEWCPGCGNFDILESLKQALCNLGMGPGDFVMASGIGQTSKMGFSIKSNNFDGLHGRTLPLALGMKMANHKAKIIAVSGDGGFYSEGGNHFIHNARRNLDITALAGDNRVYGLTKGQASPTTAPDYVTKIHPKGPGSKPINPPLLALSCGATFVARGFSGDKEQLTDLITQGINHKGFALIDIQFPCISFNKVNTFSWFKERIARIDPSHDVTDYEAAVSLAIDGDDKILTGVYYKVERPVFYERMDALSGDPIAVRTKGYTPNRVTPLFDKFK